MSKSFLIVCLASALLLFSQCGIYTFSGVSIPDNTETITLNYFPNRARQVTPILEQVLNEKLQDKFINETDLEQVPFNGDLEFSGSVTDYYVQPAAAGSNDRAALSRLTVKVKASFINRLTDEEWSETFTRFEDFDQNVNLQEVEDQLVDEIVDQLVSDIFNRALIDW